MQYFANEEVGKTRRKTPDGFLICLDVPIARTGRMVYTRADLPTYQANSEGLILVDRYPEELFKSETLASFEGMAVTNDHPPGGVMVNPKNYRVYSVGHAQNVRQGEGELADCMLADLLIMDRDAIEAVEEDDKVQVSNGYDAKYKQLAPGHLEQFGIVGNHVALVFSGRCGPRCAIGDSASHVCACEGACTCGKEVKMAVRPTLKSALQSTVASLQEAIKTADEAPNVETANGTHVHLHMPGGEGDPIPGVGDKRTKDDDNNEAATRITQMLDSVMGRLSTMEDVLADMTEDTRIKDARDKRFKDSGETEEQRKKREQEEKSAKDARRAKDAKSKDDMETEQKKLDEAKAKDEKGQGGYEDPINKDKRMRDGDMTEEEAKEAEKTKDASTVSAPLESDFQKTLELIAILAPGTHLPTFDSAAHIATTARSLCNLRRSALKNAMQREDTLKVIQPLVDSVKTLDSLPCAAVRVAFFGAAEAIRQKNNSAMGNVFSRVVAGPSSETKGVKSPAQINAENKQRWNRG